MWEISGSRRHQGLRAHRSQAVLVRATHVSGLETDSAVCDGGEPPRKATPQGHVLRNGVG